MKKILGAGAGQKWTGSAALLVAQSCNPVTGGQEYLEGACHLGFITWLGLGWLVSLLGLGTQAESDLHKRNGS